MFRTVVTRLLLPVVGVYVLGAGIDARLALAGDVTALEVATAAAENGPSATEFVRKKHDELQTAVKTAKDPKTDPKLLAIFDTMLDYDAISKDSLAGEWEGLDDGQRAEFSALLKQLVQKSYRKNLRDPADFSVEYTGAEESSQGVLVRTLAQNKANKREKALGIDYLVSMTKDGLKIRDVITDQVSLVGNYRSQFKRMLKKRGFDGLLEQMRKQLDK